MAIYVDDQIIVEELQNFLKKPVGDKVVFEEEEDKYGNGDEEAGEKSSAYKYLNIIKHFELIVGSLPHAPAATEEQSSTNNSDQNEGGSEEEVDEDAETESQASIEQDLSQQVYKVLTVYYNLVKEYDVEVDQTDVDAVVDRQVNIESKAIRQVTLTRQVGYNGPIFNPESQVKMLGTKKLHFDATVLKDGDLKAIKRCFPDLEDLVLEAQNAMAYKFDVRKFTNLKFLEIIVCPSDDYPGLISKEPPSTVEGKNYFDNFSSDEDNNDNGDEENAEEDSEF